MALPPEKNVATIFIGALFYGLYLSTFLQCLRWLIYADEGWKRRQKINWPMLIVTFLLFALSLTNLGLALRSTMLDVVKSQNPKPASKVVGSVPAPTWVTIVICTNANLSALLADAVLIHRCWLIYGRSRRVIIPPIILWLGGVACTALQAYWQVVQSAAILSAWRPVNMSIGPGTILTPFWGSTVVLNAYATSMIAHRIWSVARDSKSSTSPSQLRFINRVLVESGALYLAIAIAHFVVWWTPNVFAISVISAINLPVIGIAFNLILMRAAQYRAEGDVAEVEKNPVSSLQFKPTPTTVGHLITTRTIEIHNTSGSQFGEDSGTGRT